MASKGGRGPVPARSKLAAVPALPVEVSDEDIPEMPVCPEELGWTPRCERVWIGFWKTPHPEEFSKDAHMHLVERMMLLQLDFDMAEKATTRIQLSAEIRLIESLLMMTPADLRRAQIAPPKPAKERTAPGGPARRRDPRAG